jgi:hypothetical protein
MREIMQKKFMQNKAPNKFMLYLITLVFLVNPLFSSIENFVPNGTPQLGTTSKSPRESKSQITTPIIRLAFNKTVFDNTGFNFYLGAAPTIGTTPQVYNIDTAKTYAITRAFGQSIFGITPQETKLSSSKSDKNSYKQGPNPLYGQLISNLGLFSGRYPIATTALTTKKPNYNNKVFLITAPLDGSTVIATPKALCDAEGATTKEITALTGSGKYVFAAVSASKSNWSDNTSAAINRGIAVLIPAISGNNAATISQIAAQKINTPSSKPKAQKVDVKASAKLVSFSNATGTAAIQKAFITLDNVDMYWDSALSRLFIGLSGVKRDDVTREGGCFSVLVGRINQNSSNVDATFNLSPILNTPSKTKFTENTPNYMVGFYYNATQNITISTNKVRVMHTSTGYSYLIVNPNVTGVGSDDYNNVFALPLIGTQKEDGSPQNAALIGTLANINDFYSTPKNPTEMPQKIQAAAYVGDDSISGTYINDLFVQGDSVFVCLDDDTNQNSGIFQSTALFEADGKITTWTPWHRVMGNVQKVFGGGVDAFSNFYFLATQDPTVADYISANTIRITAWGPTQKVNLIETFQQTGSNKTDTANKNKATDQDTTPVWTSDPSRNLSTTISGIFPQKQTGVLQMINFDERTPGFLPNEFSMMVAIGYNKVALIQTLKAGSPVTTFEKSGPNQNIFAYENDPVLSKISPLCFAEVARTTQANSGWLFVGGYGGVAVLSKDTDGSGWPSQAPGLDQLTSGAYPEVGYSFKQLIPSSGDFTKIRKLASLISTDAQQLFIQTLDNLYAIDQTAANFKTGNLSATKISLNNLPEGTKFTDLLIIPNSDTNPVSTKFNFLLGTTSGLYLGTRYNKSTGKIALIKLVSATTDPALQLYYISQTKGKNSTLGNLYALSANFLTNSGKIYRYSVNGSIPLTKKTCPLTQIDTSQFIDFQNFRGNFITDGAFGFSMIGKAVQNNLMTNVYQIAQPPTDNGSIDELLGFTNLNWYLGVIGRNTASGSWLVPGDWGIMVNE